MSQKQTLENFTGIKNGEAKADSPAMSGSEVPTPRTNKVRDLINCDALSDNFSTWYDHACQLERELTEKEQRANALEGGCHMAIGYISGSTPDPEKSGTYRYLKSVTSAGLPNASVTQLVESHTSNVLVVGSNPIR